MYAKAQSEAEHIRLRVEAAVKVGRTAFGNPIVPLKPARLAVPNRPDKVQTNSRN